MKFFILTKEILILNTLGTIEFNWHSSSLSEKLHLDNQPIVPGVP